MSAWIEIQNHVDVYLLIFRLCALYYYIVILLPVRADIF